MSPRSYYRSDGEAGAYLPEVLRDGEVGRHARAHHLFPVSLMLANLGGITRRAGRMKRMQRILFSAAMVMSSAALAFTQAPPAPQGAAPAGGRGAAPRLVLSVTSTGWQDGGEVPMRHAGRGENKSPAFEFHWSTGPDAGAAAGRPADLRGDLPRHREPGSQQGHDRHAALVGVQHPGHGEGSARRARQGRSAGRHAQRPRHHGARRQPRAVLSGRAPVRARSITTSSSSTRSTPSSTCRRLRRAMT